MKPDTPAHPGLHALFFPRSVAVIGAGESPGKPGRIVTEQLIAGGMTVYPVNPRREQVLGLQAYPDISSLPEKVQVAVVAVAAEAAVGAAEEAIAAEIPFLVILAGGFGEAGEAGRELQARLAAALTGSQTRLLGPNTVGLQIPASGMDTVFVVHPANSDYHGTHPATAPATPGAEGPGLAFISQSGSVAVESLRRAAGTGVRLRAFVGLGNVVDLSATEVLSHFAADPEVGAVALYLEHLGDGRELLRLASRAAREQAVFLLKAGRSSGGAAAVASHTGRLAGSDRVVDGALKQFGIQRVADDEELIDAARVVTYGGRPRGNRVAIVTAAGGYGVMAVDRIEAPDSPLALAEPGEETQRAIREIALPFASPRNPVDLTAGVDTETFVKTVDLLERDPAVDLILVIAFFSPAAIGDTLVPELGRVARAGNTPIVAFTQDAERTDERARAFSAQGIPSFISLERAIRGLRVLVDREAVLSRLSDTGTEAQPEAPAGTTGPAPAGPSGPGPGGAPDALRQLPLRPTEADSKRLLAAYGIAVPPSRVIPPDQKLSASQPPIPDGSSGPLAVKLASPEVLHKTEAGALRLNVAPEELPAVVAEFRERFPGESLLIEEMVSGSRLELIVGASRDPDLGPALMLGAGGIYTELYRDVSFRLIPCGEAELRSMLEELTLAPVFSGFRSLEIDADALVNVLLSVNRLVTDLGDRFAELDINPLAFAAGRWIALDAKLLLRGA